MGKRLLVLLAGALALAVAAVACGGDDDKGVVRNNAPLPDYGATIGARVSTPAAAATPASPAPTVQAPAAAPSPVAPAPPPPTQPPAPAPTQPPAPPAALAPVSLNVTISNFSFAPNPITVRAGQQLTLNVTNQDAAPHTLAFQGGGPSTGNIAGNGRGSVVFTRPAPGQVQFFCEVHGAARMSGTMTILP
jgi:plastocyanin